jgi:Uma2 family endonuclease
MNWQEVCEHPSLRDLPFKIELNEYGEIVMSPTKIYHSAYQGEIGFLLRSMRKRGQVLTECAIKTRKGTKVADVAWASANRFKRIKHEFDSPIAPEVCVEVVSESNTQAHMKEKRELYFEAGAQEVWFCAKNGTISFYNTEGKLARSILFPKFPKKIEL